MVTRNKRGRPVGVALGTDFYREREDKALLGSAEARMSRFLEAAAAVRRGGGVDLVIPDRRPRRSPFDRR